MRHYDRRQMQSLWKRKERKQAKNDTLISLILTCGKKTKNRLFSSKVSSKIAFLKKKKSNVWVDIKSIVPITGN